MQKQAFMANLLYKRPTFVTSIHGDNMDHLTWFSVKCLPIFWELHFKIKIFKFSPLDGCRAPLYAILPTKRYRFTWIHIYIF